MSGDSTIVRIGRCAFQASNVGIGYAIRLVAWTGQTVTSTVKPLLPTEDDTRRIIRNVIINTNYWRQQLRYGLRPDNIERLLEEIHRKVIEEEEVFKLLAESGCAFDKNRHHRALRSRDMICSTQTRNENVPVLAPLLWCLLKSPSDTIQVPEDIRRIRSWNQRIDETRLVEKIGEPESWGIFDQTCLKEDNSNQMPKGDGGSENRTSYLNDAKVIKSRPKNSRSSLSVTDRENPSLYARFNEELAKRIKDMKKMKKSFRREDKCLKQSKKHGLFHPLKSLIGGGKESEDGIIEEFNNILDIAARSQDDDSSDDEFIKGQRGSERKSRHKVHENRQNANNCSNDDTFDDAGHMNPGELLIHVPFNVSRIVLIKDGRKITIEV